MTYNQKSDKFRPDAYQSLTRIFFRTYMFHAIYNSQGQQYSLHIRSQQYLNQLLHQISMMKFSCLREIRFNKLSEHQIKIPRLNAPLLKTIIIEDIRFPLNIQQFLSGEYPQLQTITIKNAKVDGYQNIKSMKLRMIILNNTVQDQNKIIPIFNEVYPQLRTFSVQINKISAPPILKASNIVAISLAKNNITNINEIAQIKYNFLKQFNTSDNKITELPSFENWPIIEYVNCSNNNIIDLHQFSRSLYPFLSSLKLSQNCIVNLPELSTPQLVQIQMNNNFLKQPLQLAQFSFHKNLVIYRFKGNKFATLPFQKKQHCKEAKSYQKNMHIGEEDFKKAQKHQEKVMLSPKQLKFELSSNCFTSIPEYLTLQFPAKLRELNLKQNLISNIELLNQLDLTEVRKLDLSSNKIKQLKVFSRLKLLKMLFLDLSDNSMFEGPKLSRTMFSCRPYQQLKEISVLKKEIRRIYQKSGDGMVGRSKVQQFYYQKYGEQQQFKKIIAIGQKNLSKIQYQKYVSAVNFCIEIQIKFSYIQIV